MSKRFPDDSNTIHVSSPVHRVSSPDAMPVMESPSYRIHRWIGDQDPYPATMSKSRDSEEVRARREHDHFAEVDWEVEEFEREMALRFVLRDLELGLEERRGRTSTSSRSHGDSQFDMSTITRADTDQRKRTLTPWLRAQSSTATLQPLTRLAGHSTSSSPPHSVSPSQSSFPPTPRTSHSRVAPQMTPATPESTPCSPHSDSLIRVLHPPPTTRKPSPSLLSLSSHISSCTSTASVSADTDAEVKPGPNVSALSVVSQLGQKIKHGLLTPSPPSPYPPYRPKSAPTFVEVSPPGVRSKKRRVIVPVAFVPKKKRLIVRGIKMDDDYGVEGIRRWANGLGEVSRMCRTQDGAIWVEFRDKSVADNVCHLQAQVQIPRVGRVTLDWAEGRHPG